MASVGTILQRQDSKELMLIYSPALRGIVMAIVVTLAALHLENLPTQVSHLFQESNGCL